MNPAPALVARCAALSLASLLALSVAGCDAPRDTPAQAAAPAAADGQPADDQAGTSQGETAQPDPTPEPASTKSIAELEAEGAARAERMAGQARTIPCTPGPRAQAAVAKRGAFLDNPARPLGGVVPAPVVVVGEDQVVDAGSPAVDVGALELDTVQVCIHVPEGSYAPTASWSEVTADGDLVERTEDVTRTVAGWGRVEATAGRHHPEYYRKGGPMEGQPPSASGVDVIVWLLNSDRVNADVSVGMRD
ncbi:hypothetical protein [Sinomonas halotolerans]|uniref:Uncharacterized protein n=1 Tax=Sinomonas halotolerans TaxID=1644133 RepID=A0ABU9WW20_9MICC